MSFADIDRGRRAFTWLMLVALIVLGAGIGLRDPWPSDEPRFTLAAKQMVESGDWLFPHRGSELYSDKPPMLMWWEAAAYELTRHWRIAFLLPSLLAGLATLALTYDLGRRLWNPRVGLFAAAALLATFQFVYQVKRAQIDPLVIAWITLANWGLLLHFLRGPDWRAYWIGCFAAGLVPVRRGVYAVFAALAATWLIWSCAGYPIFNAGSSAADVMRQTGVSIGPDAELGLVAWKEQNLLLADRPARDFGFSEPWPVQFAAARRWQDEAPARRRIFILENAMGDCVDKSRAIDVDRANRREWCVFGADAAIPGCIPKATRDVEGD